MYVLSSLNKTRTGIETERGDAMHEGRDAEKGSRSDRPPSDSSRQAADAATPSDRWADTEVLERLELAASAGRSGESFRAHLGGERVALLELIAATPLAGDAARGTGRAPFSLVFRGPRTIALPQGTYRIEHDALGGFPLFLVPIGPDAGGPRYEAVFA